MLTRPDKAAGEITVTKFKRGKEVSRKVVLPADCKKKWERYGRSTKSGVNGV